MRLASNCRAVAALMICLASGAALAADVEGQGEGRSVNLAPITIVGEQSSAVLSESGSAKVIDEAQLEKEEPDDLERLMQSVPGVAVRGEDGYGLRPNIGLRGTTSERSQKINILEDGILITPAPYSAPAAYYVPMLSRMVAVEVVKGPAAIRHGPNTVGGSINLVTRPIPFGESAGVDLAAGSDGYGKGHGYYGASTEQAGILVEGIRVQTDGFKELDGGGDTGFERQNGMVKLRLNTPLENETYQQVELKLNFADELSNETYLGLSDDDFAANPYRRYAGSQNDVMDWQHRQVALTYTAELPSGLSLHSTLYNHEFERAWTKLNRFNTNDRTLLDILSNPDSGQNLDYMAVLRGEQDSTLAQETLMIGTNDRSFYSRGFQNALKWSVNGERAVHDLEVGLRFHQDRIRRDQTEEGFLMTGGQLVADGNGDIDVLLNTESADAVALYVEDQIRFDRLTLRAGLRGEHILYDSFNRLTTDAVENTNSALMPAAGMHYQLTQELGLLAGVHRGFVPTGPGQSDSLDPEESTNFEAGFRYARDSLFVEMIGFFTDYGNLKGLCTFSSGCSGGSNEAFSGGQVDVYGIEFQARRVYPLVGELTLPIALAYTFTDSEFGTSFDSGFPQWGEVEQGDRLPYQPRHTLNLSAGVSAPNWDMALSWHHVGSQLEQAGEAGETGTDGPLAGVEVPSYSVLDLNGQYRFDDRHSAYFKVDNLTDEVYLTSRRPFGARPGKPRTLLLGYKYSF
jgi:Fe(3+) dicitrate transport protein